MQSVAVSVLATFVFACAPPPALHATTSAPVATLAPAPSPPARREAPHALTRPSSFACEYTSEAWSGSSIPLHAGVDRQPFATVPEGWRVSVGVPLGEAAALFVHAEHEGAVLEGWVDARQLPLYATRAETFHDFALPSRYAVLYVREGETGALVTHLGIAPEVATVPAELDTLQARCDFFALETRDFSTHDLDRHQSFVVFDEGPVVLLDAPKGKELLRFRGGNFTPSAVLLESRGAWRRIRWDAADVDVTGWVSAARVRRGMNAANWARTATTESKPVVPSAFHWSESRCSVAVDLLLGDGDAPIVVGKIAAGTLVRLGPSRDDGARAYARTTDTHRVEDAKLFVGAEVATRCTPTR